MFCDCVPWTIIGSVFISCYVCDMDHTPSLTAMLVNLLIQIIQIWVFFGVFVYVFGNKISTAVYARKSKEQKLAHAEIEYARMIDEAQQKSDAILKEALQHKNHIIDEAEEMGQNKIHDMIAWAQTEIEILRQEAIASHAHMESELQSWFETMVKHTAQLSLKKLITNKETSAYNDYLDTIIKSA